MDTITAAYAEFSAAVETATTANYAHSIARAELAAALRSTQDAAIYNQLVWDFLNGPVEAALHTAIWQVGVTKAALDAAYAA